MRNPRMGLCCFHVHLQNRYECWYRPAVIIPQAKSFQIRDNNVRVPPIQSHLRPVISDDRLSVNSNSRMAAAWVSFLGMVEHEAKPLQPAFLTRIWRYSDSLFTINVLVLIWMVFNKGSIRKA